MWNDAISHSFTTISTGGFSTYDSSFAFFNNDRILLVAIIFMILGSLPFLVLVQTSKKNLFAIFKDHQVRVFILILFIAIVLIFYFANSFIDGNYLNKIAAVSFNTISIISGTGYVSENFENWGNYASVLFLILMFIGGCAGSTTGGLKIFRFQILFKYINLHLKKMLKPHSIIASRFNGRIINETTYESVMSYYFLYILTFFTSALLLSFSGLDFLTCISAAASTISNVGPGLGPIIGPDGNYGTLDSYSKIILIATMFLGRQELLTILVILLPSFWKD